MAKAPQSEQHRLLDLQALDSRLVKLGRRAAALAADPEVSAASAAHAEASAAQAVVEAELNMVRKDLAAQEQEVEGVQARIDKDQKRLDSGVGTSKDLMGLQHELETLGKRKSDLEDAELELMETLDEVTARVEAATAAARESGAQLARLEAGRDAELEAVEAERAETSGQRAALAGTFEPALLALYEKTLAQRGIGAARLFHGVSEGSGIALSPGDLAEIKAAAEDAVVFCPDSGCILVRSADWGS